MKKTNIDELQFDHTADSVTEALLLNDIFLDRAKHSLSNIENIKCDKNSEALEIFLYDLGPKDIQEFAAAMWIFTMTITSQDQESIIKTQLTKLAAEATKTAAEACDSVKDLKEVVHNFCDLIIKNA